MIVVDGSTAPRVEAAPGALRSTLVQGERTTLVRFDLRPGAEIPLHDHLHEQTGYLISGDLTLMTATGECEVVPGDAWSIPGRVPHAARSAGGAVLVEVFVPVREEYLPAAAARLPRPGSQRDR
jgi:unsaturated pyranuronate lyase